MRALPNASCALFTRLALHAHCTNAGCSEVAATLSSLHVSIDESPSSFCDSKVCAKYQSASGGPAFHCFRPFVGPPLALPASLVSPVFGAFLDDCGAELPALERCDMESNCAMALLNAMPAFYKKEEDRQARVNEALQTLLGVPFTLFQPNPAESASRSDGGIVVPAGEVDALLLVVEHKNEMHGGDPYFQLQRTYGMFWEAPGRHECALHCIDCCPALALEVVGPLLRVNALATLHANRVLCEPLTPFLPVLHLRDQPAAMARLVVTLRALRAAVQRLRRHYEVRAQAAATPPPRASAGGRGRDPVLALPYPLRDGTRFSSVEHLCRGKLLYAAHDAAHAGALVCVKFSRRGYGDAVHRAWADAGHAPVLHEARALPGGLVHVVMELLPKTAGWRMLAELPPPDEDAAWAAAAAALRAAHAAPLRQGGFGAHSDCRPVNVLVRNAGGTARGDAAGGWDVRFVDFDGAGADGGRLYPPFMSPAVQWPRGALPGLPLARAHDAELLTLARPRG